jgi:broad specificity phosphatase PhoE
MIELILIRHGQTHTNVAGRWHGWSDQPLTPFGQVQAQATARRLAPERDQIRGLYTSPLRRAAQTADVIGAALGREAIQIEDLKEINFGELEGTSLEEMEHQHPALFARWQDKTDMSFQWPGGERRADFFRRATDACQQILARHSGGKIVAVAHGGTIRACLAHLLPHQLSRWWDYALDNCGLNRVRIEKDKTQLIALNDGTHLPQR